MCARRTRTPGGPSAPGGRGHGPPRSVSAMGCFWAGRSVGFPSPRTGRTASGQGKERYAGHGREEVRCAGAPSGPGGARSWPIEAARSNEPWRLGCLGAARVPSPKRGGVPPRAEPTGTLPRWRAGIEGGEGD